MPSIALSRRSFLAMSATLPWALSVASSRSIPVGLELYSVRDALKKDPEGTVRAVAQMGYQAVEFYAPYFEWTDAQAKQMRKLMDDLGIKCYSTHNNADYFLREEYQSRPRPEPDSRLQVCRAGVDRPEDRDRWLEDGRRQSEFRRRDAGARWSQARISQSSGGVDAGERAASDGCSCQKHEAFGDAATGCGDLSGRRAPTRWHGSEPTRDAFGPSIVKTGRAIPAKATRSCSARAWPTGKASFRRRRASAALSTTWSSRREAGSRNSRRRSKCLQAFRATHVY